MIRLRNAFKVNVFQFIAVCFPRDPVMCAGLWWTMNVSDAEGERDTMRMHVHAGASVHTHLLHASFSS